MSKLLDRVLLNLKVGILGGMSVALWWYLLTEAKDFSLCDLASNPLSWPIGAMLAIEVVQLVLSLRKSNSTELSLRVLLVLSLALSLALVGGIVYINNTNSKIIHELMNVVKSYQSGT